jgi:hypothetical protein
MRGPGRVNGRYEPVYSVAGRAGWSRMVDPLILAGEEEIKQALLHLERIFLDHPVPGIFDL